MLKQKYFLTDIFILSAEKQPIKSSWRKIEWLHVADVQRVYNVVPNSVFLKKFLRKEYSNLLISKRYRIKKFTGKR